MPLFITYASYSNAGIKGIVDKPTNRTEVIQAMVEKARRQAARRLYDDGIA